MRRDDYRRDIDDLIVRQSGDRDLPICPFDHKSCPTPDRGCQATYWGVMAKNGEEEIAWTCPRFKPDSVEQFR
jgi:hypothetical protein